MKLVALAAACSGCLLTPDAPTCDGPYGPPVKLYEVASAATDEAPWMSRDRLELLFASERDGMFHIYRTTRTTPDGMFAPPVMVGDGTMYQQNPFITSDGLTLFYLTFNGPSPIYRATRSDRDAPFQPGVPVPEFSTADAITFTDDQLDVFYNPFDGGILTAHRSSTAEDFPPAHPIDLGPDGYTKPSITGDGAVLFVNHKLPNNERILARSERRADGSYGPVVDLDLPINSYDGSSLLDDLIVYANGPGDTDLFTVERSCR